MVFPLLTLVVACMFATCWSADNHCLEKSFEVSDRSKPLGWVPLSCPEGLVFREIQFASFGNPTGSCDSDGTGHFQHGICEGNTTFILNDVQNKCINQSKCRIEIHTQYFGPQQFCMYSTQSFAAEWSCHNASIAVANVNNLATTTTEREHSLLYIIIGSSGAGVAIIIGVALFVCKRCERSCLKLKPSRYGGGGYGGGGERLITMDDLEDNDSDDDNNNNNIINNNNNSHRQKKLRIPVALETRLLKSNETDFVLWSNNDMSLYGNRELRQLAKEGRIPLATSDDYAATKAETLLKLQRNQQAFANIKAPSPSSRSSSSHQRQLHKDNAVRPMPTSAMFANTDVDDSSDEEEGRSVRGARVAVITPAKVNEERLPPQTTIDVVYHAPSRSSSMQQQRRPPTPSQEHNRSNVVAHIPNTVLGRLPPRPANNRLPPVSGLHLSQNLD